MRGPTGAVPLAPPPGGALVCGTIGPPVFRGTPQGDAAAYAPGDALPGLVGPASTVAWGRAAVRAHIYRRRESTSYFQIVVSTFTTITNKGQPWRMPLVACHHRPRAPTTLKARRSYLYMAPRARHVAGSMPSSNARANTTSWGRDRNI